MASREEAKNLRRARIVRAARSLIQETEQTGFSMRALADRAGVSLATPYNLFGSKQAVLYTLLDEDIQNYSIRLQGSNKDELELFFEAVSLGKTFFAREQNYYRAVLFEVYNGGGREYRSMFHGPRRELWRSLVADAIRAGYLCEDVDTDAFALNLAFVFFAAILEWVSGEISLNEMDTRTQYGFALALLAMSRPAYHERLRGIAIRMQKRLKKYAKTSDLAEAV